TYGTFPHFSHDTSTPSLYTLSLHDALPIYIHAAGGTDLDRRGLPGSHRLPRTLDRRGVSRGARGIPPRVRAGDQGTDRRDAAPSRVDRCGPKQVPGKTRVRTGKAGWPAGNRAG